MSFLVRAGTKKENLISTIVDCDGKKKKAAHVVENLKIAKLVD